MQDQVFISPCHSLGQRGRDQPVEGLRGSAGPCRARGPGLARRIPQRQGQAALSCPGSATAELILASGPADQEGTTSSPSSFRTPWNFSSRSSGTATAVGPRRSPRKSRVGVLEQAVGEFGGGSEEHQHPAGFQGDRRRCGALEQQPDRRGGGCSRSAQEPLDDLAGADTQRGGPSHRARADNVAARRCTGDRAP